MFLSSPTPVPSAVISVVSSCELSMRSNRTFSTFRILPRSGRIAWNWRLRPCLAEPPALSPPPLKLALLTVGQLARQRGQLERALALHHLERLARGLARPRRDHGLVDDVARLLR